VYHHCTRELYRSPWFRDHRPPCFSALRLFADAIAHTAETAGEAFLVFRPVVIWCTSIAALLSASRRGFERTYLVLNIG
jgi:hypothetical protein